MENFTKKEIIKIASKYSRKVDFLKGDAKAYRKAFSLGILDSVCSHMEQRKKPTKWTKEKIEKVAANYKVKAEFARNESGPYRAAWKLGVLDDVCAHMESRRKPWTNSELQNEALKYITRFEFQKESSGAYTAAFHKKILEKICSHMPENASIVWTKKKAFQEAKKYSTTSEFKKKSSGCFKFLVKNGHYDEATNHFTTLGSKHYRAVYSFEFEDGSVYVGLTFNLERRFNDHHLSGPVSKKLDNCDAWFYELTDYLDVESAKKMEEAFLQEYKRCNWKILNRAKTGGVGGINVIWTKEAVLEEAAKYKTLTEFQNINGSAYMAALRNKYLDEVREILPSKIQKWSVEKIMREMKKYKNLKDLRENNPNLVQMAFKYNCYKEATAHIPRLKGKSKKPTYE